MAQLQYFIEILNKEINHLKNVCEKWNKISTLNNIPDEAYGKILSATGQTKMLIYDKLEQFRKLVDVYDKENQEKKITIDDLQGFWDLVNIQIEDVNRKFHHLEQLKANKWESLNNIVNSVCQHSPMKRKSRQNSFNKSHSEAAKLRLARAKMQLQTRLNKSKEF